MEGWFDGEVIKGRWNEAFSQWIYCIQYDERDVQDIVSEDELEDIALNKERYHDPTLFSFEEFLTLWERLRPEEIEKSAAIRRANTKITTEDSGTQHNAQYGRFLPGATDVSAINTIVVEVYRVDTLLYGMSSDYIKNQLTVLLPVDPVSSTAIETIRYLSGRRPRDW